MTARASTGAAIAADAAPSHATSLMSEATMVYETELLENEATRPLKRSGAFEQDFRDTFESASRRPESGMRQLYITVGDVTFVGLVAWHWSAIGRQSIVKQEPPSGARPLLRARVGEPSSIGSSYPCSHQ